MRARSARTAPGSRRHQPRTVQRARRAGLNTKVRLLIRRAKASTAQKPTLARAMLTYGPVKLERLYSTSRHPHSRQQSYFF